MNGWEIRRDVLTAHELMDMRTRCELADLDTEGIDTALANSVFTLSAFAGSRLVGMLRVIGDRSFVYLIYDVMVDPAYRHKGIGRALVLRALSEIEQMTALDRWASVNLFSVPDKESFYKHLGFMTLPHDRLGAGMQMFLKGKK